MMVTSERWIYILGKDSLEEPDSFVKLVKEYSFQLSGTVKAVSEATQYIIDNDPLNLMFQWDSCFGITVVVPEKTDIKLAEKTMQELCDKLNKDISN
jgi:hypothetical protein